MKHETGNDDPMGPAKGIWNAIWISLLIWALIVGIVAMVYAP